MSYVSYGGHGGKSFVDKTCWDVKNGFCKRAAEGGWEPCCAMMEAWCRPFAGFDDAAAVLLTMIATRATRATTTTTTTTTTTIRTRTRTKTETEDSAYVHDSDGDNDNDNDDDDDDDEEEEEDDDAYLFLRLSRSRSINLFVYLSACWPV